ncbi:IS30 family transposase [Streptomyces sp. NPDC046197]|uniref:IS30 family transposase n=1 Tax=Streptomyces sp. NPDC046197 TaxID=3154337 RepID=UPI0033E5C489
MPEYPPNRLPLSVPKAYFKLRRGGLKGAAAARRVGVSTSAGSVWFIKAGRMLLPDKPIDERYLTQDDRITIADGLLAGRPATVIAADIGKHRSTVYREISRGRGPDGAYNPWWSHNQAILRRQRPKPEKLRASAALRDLVNDKLKQRWSPQQIARHLTLTQPGQPAMNASPETIYRALYNGVLDKRIARLRTRRTRRKKQRRGIPLTNAIPRMRPVHTRPTEAEERRSAGHWEGDLILGKGQASAIGTLVDRAARYVRLIHLPAAADDASNRPMGRASSSSSEGRRGPIASSGSISSTGRLCRRPTVFPRECARSDVRRFSRAASAAVRASSMRAKTNTLASVSAASRRGESGPASEPSLRTRSKVTHCLIRAADASAGPSRFLTKTRSPVSVVPIQLWLGPGTFLTPAWPARDPSPARVSRFCTSACSSSVSVVLPVMVWHPRQASD